jgi:ferrochelatase
MMKGLLLINLGTPDAPTVPAVRRYLRQFLSDPLVIDIPWIFRMLLLYFIILPFRPAKSAEAYQQVWTKEGSPLLVYGQALTKAVAERLGSDWAVRLGMRYGNPSIGEALKSLVADGVTQLVVLPLYPQWASSSTESSVQEFKRLVATVAPELETTILGDFFTLDGFIDAQADQVTELMGEQVPESTHVVYSFHGLPERHILAENAGQNHCLAKPDCCAQVGSMNRRCYRAQCFATARALSARLNLTDDQWSVGFQSRLGRAQWIEPDTVPLLENLAASGCSDVLVLCPSFVADCLETLEEMDIRGKEVFQDAGGKTFSRALTVNTHPKWVEAVAKMAEQAV